MKFEKFLKYCGVRGTIVNTSEGQFLKLANVFFKIPVGVNVLSAVTTDAPEFIENIFDDFDDEMLYKAELTAAELEAPDAGPSAIRRVWTNSEKGYIKIANKIFGMIERSDHAYTFSESQNAEDEQDALVITTGYGNDEAVSAIILDTQYYYNSITNKEENNND